MAPRHELTERELNRTLDLGSAVGSMQLAKFLGVSFRQLDYGTRQSVLHEQVGHGKKRVWTPPVIRRLQVAALLARHMPTRQSAWPGMIDIVAQGPAPPDEGYVLLRDEQVSYSPTPPALNPREGGVVVRYDDLWPLEGPDDFSLDAPEGFAEVDEYDPELNADAPVSYYEGPDTEEEAGLR